MPILRKFKRKEKGVEETVHLGALAQNITQDATHRFVTDVEKQAWNAKPGADTQNLKTYTALSQLGLSAPVTMEQIYSQMPSSSFFIMGVEGTGDISNLPENDTYGIIEIFKRDRNFARFTPSLSSAMAGSMFYGTFSWSGGVAFTGWKRIIDDKRLANNLTTTAEGYGLDARQGKVLMDKANQLISEIADAKQELGGIEYGTVTVTAAASADLNGVHKVNKTAYLTIHGKTVTHALTSGIAHFQSSIPPASPIYIPYFIMNGASSRVQLAYMDQNGNISLAGGEDININEWFLFSTSYRTN